MKTRYLIGVMVIIAVALVEYGLVSLVNLNDHSASGPAGPPATPAPSASNSPPPVYDVTDLIKSTHKFAGVTVQGAPGSMAPITVFAKAIARRPNIIEFYEGFTDGFDASGVRRAYQYGALPLISWEPTTVPMAKIAAGDKDNYIEAFARDVRTLNLPVAITLGHEMNGNWYPWGRQKTKATDFVAAWRHVHSVFGSVGATNVIWVWTPNVINPAPRVRLGPLYPGDAFVDWVGMDGYYTHKGQQTFSTLFGPTTTAVRKFTKKPILIVETGAESGSSRPAEITDLFHGVTHTPGFIGFIWFDNRGSGSWRIDDDRTSVAAFKRGVRPPEFGYDVHGRATNGTGQG